MNKAQRIAAFIFAAILWFIAFAAVDAGDRGNGWIGFASLLVGMGLILSALRTGRDQV